MPHPRTTNTTGNRIQLYTNATREHWLDLPDLRRSQAVPADRQRPNMVTAEKIHWFSLKTRKPKRPKRIRPTEKGGQSPSPEGSSSSGGDTGEIERGAGRTLRHRGLRTKTEAADEEVEQGEELNDGEKGGRGQSGPRVSGILITTRGRGLGQRKPTNPRKTKTYLGAAGSPRWPLPTGIALPPNFVPLVLVRGASFFATAWLSRSGASLLCSGARGPDAP
ncbi:hypothetical protein MRX96_008291 [Rhipicephalus microplus]